MGKDEESDLQDLEVDAFDVEDYDDELPSSSGDLVQHIKDLNNTSMHDV
jgi:hypothetical protein